MDMETKQKLGSEPAFPPTREMQELAPTCEGYHVGMSKRFYAACAAMQGLTANSHEDLIKMDFETLSKQAFRIADWMLNQEEQQ